MPAEYWYVPRVIFVQKVHPTRTQFVHADMGRSVVSFSRVVVEHPSLASPGPSRTVLSQLGVLVCVGILLVRLCFYCVC